MVPDVVQNIILFLYSRSTLLKKSKPLKPINNIEIKKRVYIYRKLAE